jgi:2'-5' RNA ligase superfamily
VVPLLLMIPGADSLVEAWRADHDWAARHGIGAHVTVRMPFLEPAQWDDAALAGLSNMLPVELKLARLEDRPGALVILVRPDDQLRRITTMVGELWPDLPPHKADYERPAYHITVVRTADPDIRRTASEEISPKLPMRVTGTAFWVAHGSAESGLTCRIAAGS